MPFEEKVTWVSLVVAVVVPVAYFAIMLGRLGDVSAADISYQWPLLIAIVASVVLTIVGLDRDGASAPASRPSCAADPPPATSTARTSGTSRISRHGDLIGFYVSSVGMVGVLALTMLEYEYFWIASALYLSFVVGTLVASVVKIVAYHRGF